MTAPVVYDAPGSGLPRTRNGLVLDPAAPVLVGGFPQIGTGVESVVVQTQAGGAATDGYVGIVAQAAKTWIRCAIGNPLSSSIQQFFCYRGIGGHTLLPGTPFKLQGASAPLARITGGADKSVLTATSIGQLTEFPAFTGNVFVNANFAQGFPLILLPGDALLLVAGTVNVNAAVTIYLTELAA